MEVRAKDAIAADAMVRPPGQPQHDRRSHQALRRYSADFSASGAFTGKARPTDDKRPTAVKGFGRRWAAAGRPARSHALRADDTMMPICGVHSATIRSRS